MQRRGPLPRNWIVESDTPDTGIPQVGHEFTSYSGRGQRRAARKYGLSAPVSRRTVLGGLTLLPLVAVNGVPPAASADPADVVDAADTPYLYLSPHQAAVLDAATRRLIPGPEDDSAGNHPGGARSKRGPLHGHHAVRRSHSRRPRCTPAGRGATAPAAPRTSWPTSSRSTAPRTTPGNSGSPTFAASTPPASRYLTSWPAATSPRCRQTKQDSILTTGQAVSFTQLLFGHAIEGMYSVPEYGGNANLVGWQDIEWPGDIQPRGYTDAEVEAPRGRRCGDERNHRLAGARRVDAGHRQDGRKRRRQCR